MTSTEQLSEPVEGLWRISPAGPDRYHGWGQDGGWPRVFGGQVAAQALAAAGADLPGWWPASLQAYFVREGRSSEEIEYRVDRVETDAELTDAELTVRRVTAAQSGRPIFTLDARLQPLPADVGLPERSSSPLDIDGWNPEGAEEERWMARRGAPLRFDLRFATRPTRVAGRRGEVALGQRFWLRTAQPLPDEPLHHACALTYASDLFLVSVALARHGLPARREDIQAASIDHALWFHRPFRADDWMLYEQASPTSACGRGLLAGRILNRDGERLATVRQEVLLRVP